MAIHFSKQDFVGVDANLHDAMAPDVQLSGTGDDLEISVHLSGSTERTNYRLTDGDLFLRGDAADKGGYEKFVLGSSQIFLERAHLNRMRNAAGTDNRSEFLYHDQVGWTGNRATVMVLNVAGQDVVLASRYGMSGFATFEMDSDGILSPLGSVADDALSYAADVHLMASTEIGGKTFIFTASQLESGISSYEMGLDHSVTFRDSLGANEYLGMNAPSTVLTTHVGGNDFLLVGDAGMGSIRVMGISATGQLSDVSIFLDDKDTRFSKISAMSSIEVGGTVYVVAGGADDGLSLFLLSPRGTLVHLKSIEDTNHIGLTNLTDIELHADGSDIHVFVTSEVAAGLTHLVIDTSAAGQVLDGGAGAEHLVGAGKDDVLLDGAGRDTLTGGSGDDLFVLAADGAVDVISDFDMAQDRINISAWRGLHSVFQLSLIETSTGAIIRYEDEELILKSANGQTITFVDLVQSNALGMPQSYLSGKDATAMAGHDRLSGSAGKDHLFGFAGNDTLNGYAGSDNLSGGDGNDMLVGGAGGDTLDGGTGVDTISYASATTRINLDLRSGGTYGDAANDTFLSIENVQGSNLGDYVYGSDADNVIDGGDGNDRLRGHTGDDTLIGGKGADDLNGGSGIDTASYAGAGTKVNLDMRSRGTYGDAKDDTFVSIENLIGSRFGDYVYGNDANNVIDGGDGNDRLRGHSGNDTLIGGKGADDLNGGSGIDTASYAGAGTKVNLDMRSRGTYGDAKDDTFSSIENVTGSRFGDYVYGSDADNVIDGGDGNDRLRGHTGDDTLIGGKGADDLNGGSGIDTASYAGAGTKVNLDMRSRGTYGDAKDDTFVSIENVTGSRFGDYVYGSDADNVIDGGEGNDRLRGHSGDDTLVGGEGADDLHGGAGADVFVFRKGDGADRISDFQDNVDMIRLDGAFGGEAAVFGMAMQQGDDVLFDFGNGDTLLIDDVSIAQLQNDVEFF